MSANLLPLALLVFLLNLAPKWLWPDMLPHRAPSPECLWLPSWDKGWKDPLPTLCITRREQTSERGSGSVQNESASEAARTCRGTRDAPRLAQLRLTSL
jgi:hypothetical protein